MTPRPALLVTLTYGAGLATGLLHFGAPVSALAVVAVAALCAWHVRRALLVLLLVGMALGRATAAVAWAADAETVDQANRLKNAGL